MPVSDRQRILLILCVLLVLAAVLFPIVWMVFAAIRPTTETLAFPTVWFPRDITFAAFAKLFSNASELRYFANSYIIALSTAGLTILLAAPCSYGFSRFRIRGATTILLGILALQMLPTVALILPFFSMARTIGVYNTHLGLILADTAFTLPVGIWLLKGFFDSIPTALEESAMVDGGTRLQALIYVILPLAVPGLVSTGVFAFLWSWNEFLFAVVLTSGEGAAPLTIRMSQFFTQYGRDWNGIMALNVIASIPLVVFFVFMQRWVVSGLTGGAVKG
ncbi:MAG: carbohydrate ABC transporter permease [Rhodospirillales bacterium]|nr:carbohydrate ABC transporter permease [Rhodospirillales bacterium]